MAELADILDITVEFEALARKQLLAGDRYEAEQTARAVIAVAPKSAQCWRLLGDILSSMPGRRAEAAEAFSSALEFDPGISRALDGQKALGARATAAPSNAKKKPLLPHLGAMSGKDALIADARAAEASEHWHEARRCWERVLKHDPADTWAWSQYAHLLSVHIHSYGEAETAYRRAIEEDPTDDWAWGKLGIMIADFQGRVSEGQTLLREAIRLDPSEPYYHGWLGWSLYRQSENLEAAELELEAATQLQKDYQWAHFHLGYVRYVMGTKAKAARADFLKAIALDPLDIAALYNLGALAIEQLHQPKQAIKAFSKILAIEPEHLAGHFRLAQIYEQDEATNAQARYHYQKILESDPENLMALHGLGFLCCEKQDLYEDARTAFEAVLDIAPDDDEIQHRLGCLFWQDLNRVDEGIVHLQTACELAPECELYWASLGEAFAYAKLEFSAAEDNFKKALELAPDYYWVHCRLGEMLCNVGDRLGDAKTHLCRAVEINPEYAWGWQTYAGFLNRHAQDFDGAQRAYEKAIALDPEDFSAAFELAEMNIFSRSRADLAAALMNDLREALPADSVASILYAVAQRFLNEDIAAVSACFEHATTLDSENHRIWHNRAEHTLYECGDIQEAEYMLLRAADLDNGCSRLWADLGLIRLAQGEQDIARALVEKALEEDDESADNWRLYGRFLYLIKEDSSLIEEALDRAFEFGPYNFENPLFLAVFLRTQSDRQEEAAVAWTAAQTLCPLDFDLERWADLQMRPIILRQ